jgi:hypothetical protein
VQVTKNREITTFIFFVQASTIPCRAVFLSSCIVPTASFNLCFILILYLEKLKIAISKLHLKGTVYLLLDKTSASRLALQCVQFTYPANWTQWTDLQYVVHAPCQLVSPPHTDSWLVLHTPCQLVSPPHTLPAGQPSAQHPAGWSDLQCVHTPCHLIRHQCVHTSCQLVRPPVCILTPCHTHTHGWSDLQRARTQLQTPCQKTSTSFDTLAALIKAGIQSDG